VRQGRDPTTGEPIVTVALTRRGNRAFHELTRQAAVRGALRRSPQHLAIILDGALRASPQIDYTRYPDGIDASGGGAQVTGLRSAAEARNVAVVLRTGALPVGFVVVPR
jgi:preprotein translocase subunit SecD